ncbi:MAG: xanthine dehydrogenase accessory protein XdhC [Candidatus Melainabacteria bacterium HGW-Melainabacteria-1]|nr:MAG: xanthine dehydrogenase accessory protein XdhC [Candidatus Melainabacteria bacterium HGW-Melainabacteria-1]
MSDEREYHSQVLALIEAGRPFVVVTLLDAIGSAPQNPGARMLVTELGLGATPGPHWGTVGGGKIEMACLARAKEMLSGTEPAQHFVEWNLQRDIGMTCGGVVRMYFELYVQQAWRIAVFGAGHVAQALVPVLSSLKCRLWCIDARPEWVERLPAFANLTALHSAVPADEVAKLPRDSFIVSMTMGHAHDLPILAEALRIKAEDPQAFPFIGVIGSPSKAGVIRRDLAKRGFDKDQQQQIVCPLGLPVGSNDPAEMAISIAGQLLQERDRLLGGGKWARPGYQRSNRSHHELS